MPVKIEQSAVVAHEHRGMRLDQLAAELFPDFSRSRLQTWIRKGELKVDGEVVRPRDKVLVGSVLVLSAEQEESARWTGEDIALDVVFEDDCILVLNKPAGLVVHPAAGHHDGTLVNALLHHAPELAALPRAGIVHRLDKDTTGLMVVAKTLQAHHHLVDQLHDRSVSRQYAAVCIGAMTGGGTVDAPLGRHPRARKKMAVVATGGKDAVTHYQLAERFGHHTLVHVRLETGRTHQIRVHMAHLHYPLVGDPAYGGRRRIPPAADEELVAALRSFPRQALHARILGLRHPRSEDALEWEAPLPDDLQGLLACLRQHDPFTGHAR